MGSQQPHRVRVIGHRGAAGLKPENTLAGWAYALDLGVDLVEADVRMTKDGHAVMMHDKSVDRTTNGTGDVAELTLEQIRSLDAGDGEKVPLLTEFLDLLKARSGHALVEAKEDAALDVILEEVRARDLKAQVCITAKLPIIERARTLDPDIALGLVGRTHTLDDLKRAAAIGTHGVGFQYTLLTPELLQACRDFGMIARGWNPKTREEIEDALRLGLDDITTDRPDIALELLGRR